MTMTVHFETYVMIRKLEAYHQKVLGSKFENLKEFIHGYFVGLKSRIKYRYIKKDKELHNSIAEEMFQYFVNIVNGEDIEDFIIC